MKPTSVTSKGQVTIPQQVRQKLGIRQGTTVAFSVVGDHVELRLLSQRMDVPGTGFGLLKAQRKAVPVDFDVATVIVKARRKASQ
jgi:AbrB family looped-hinge helix DNA binding protein